MIILGLLSVDINAENSITLTQTQKKKKKKPTRNFSRIFLHLEPNTNYHSMLMWHF